MSGASRGAVRPGLFAACGIELEFMVAEQGSLRALPAVDVLLADLAGGTLPGDHEVLRGDLAWSNEFVLHVVELKHPEPLPSLSGFTERLGAEVQEANRLLARRGGLLLPGGAHPFFDPPTETRLWPHGRREVYETYDRIFDCRTHGFANLQSAHLNLSFNDDEGVAKLHRAVRALLPLLPALAASSPVRDGRFSGWLDGRLEAYRANQARLPRVTGLVVPERASSRAEYEERILAPLGEDLRAFDPVGLLEPEWVNSRGAIPRFERMALEVRVLDAVAREGEEALLSDAGFLACFGWAGGPVRAGVLRENLLSRLLREGAPLAEWEGPLGVILSQGTLARRILRALRGDFSRGRLVEVWGRLARCLEENRAFEARP